MSTCYKCGRELPDGQVECDGVCSTVETPEELEAMDREFARDYMEVDWAQVKTVEDVVNVLSAWDDYLFVPKKHPRFESLKKYLKPVEP